LKKYFIVGGAGFIGSHLVNLIVQQEDSSRVVIYDNFSSGKMWHLDEVKDYSNIEIVRDDVKNSNVLKVSMKGSDVVYHFASNPDIAKAITQPDIDFWEGTYLTNNVLEAMRVNGIKNLLYSSGSGVYGDTGFKDTNENYSPMLPISTYGASKLACESLICSYCHMFDMNACAFRFANVVGSHQTHGVGYDFIKKLLDNPNELKILGDGSQSKSYIYIRDVLNAMRLIEKNYLKGYSFYNVATLDYITVNEIADIVTKKMNLKSVEYSHTVGNRGWKGDVPVVRLGSEKIREKGWKNEYTSREAIELSVSSMFEDAKSNKFSWNGGTA
jgi:UDP-glucose 4-epimerase